MALDQRKHEHSHKALLRDIRPLWMRIGDALSTRDYSVAMFVMFAVLYFFSGNFFQGWPVVFGDVLLVIAGLYFWWLKSYKRSLAFKMPMGSPYKDPHNDAPGRNMKPEGILYLGNMENTDEEIWFTNSDARTHVLYLGTTGAGKTEGLKSMVTNAMAWGSGFVYVDGKADTDLWSSLSALVRRFGRDDDLLVLNYMTGNSDAKAPSNTMNPFSSGSASYLTNMLVSLMPESEGDNAMWKERAVSLVSAMMPVLTWKRDKQDIPMSVRTIRDNLSLNNVVKLARDNVVPEELRAGMNGYLDTLPGYVADAFDDNGQIKPPDGGGPPPDTTTANQQHGYLAMQFTRSLQSLGDDYGYIFDTQAADVDMIDVVLNRRILIVLIPALEKSGDEIANLGKIVAATMKGMMGGALGSTVEGESATVIENKPTHSSTPFMTVFDEVGYYTAEGMAVMAAQARSLGFCLVFSGQDLPAMKKRVREEANSITANCNIKIFGKLEDPTETKEFFEKTVGTALVTEVSGYQLSGSGSFSSYYDTQQAGVQERARASYDGLRGFKEGQAIITFGETVVDSRIFYSNPGNAKAMRVTRFLALPPPDEAMINNASVITQLRDLMVNKTWTAERSDVAVETPKEIQALVDGFKIGEKSDDVVETGIAALIAVHALDNPVEAKASASASAPAETTAKAPTGQAPQDITMQEGAAPLVTPDPTPAEKPAQKSSEENKKPLPESLTSPLGNLVTSDETAPQKQAPPDENAGNPMGFFGKPGAAAQPAVEPVQKEEPQPIEEPVKPAQENTEIVSGANIPQKPIPARKSLPPEIENILKSAARSGRNAIFKNTDKSGGVDAAE